MRWHTDPICCARDGHFGARDRAGHVLRDPRRAFLHCNPGKSDLPGLGDVRLLLALLVTGELSFQTTESLVPFFNVYASVLSGKRLYQELQTFNATAEEAMIASQESQSNYEVDNIRSILDYISRLLGE